jgi:asparagine synthase (glutamine-hydrolysing)
VPAYPGQAWPGQIRAYTRAVPGPEMSGVLGIVAPDGAPVGRAQCDRSRRTVVFHGGHIAALAPVDATGDLHFCAAGRVDARDELASELGLAPAQAAARRDPDLLLAAYRRWGEDAPRHLIGDWSLAAWHPHQRRLFLARDPLGNGSIYYHLDGETIAFAPTLPVLLAIKPVSLQLDELYLAQFLISWAAYHGPGTIFTGVNRLPPAHALTVTPEGTHLRAYWQLGPLAELRLPQREDYVVAFREVFDQAVRDRLPPEGDVAVTLSGGLDSSSVAATAAGVLRSQGRRLRAFTSVPVSDPSAYAGARFGDESPFARAVAAKAGNIDLETLPATRLSPIQAVRVGLDLFGSPIHAAGNLFWLLDLVAEADASGATRLLTGQLGNASISWHGDPLSQPLRYQLDCFGVRRSIKLHLRRSMPIRARGAVARYRFNHRDNAFGGSAIRPAFARRLRLIERRMDDPQPYAPTPLDERMAILKPGRSLIGDAWAAQTAGYGIAAADPTADVRLLELTLAVPDRIFIDPRTGTNRWLIREAMQGRLPDEVRLNRGRGVQAADLVPRLRACADEVEDALDEIASGPAADYLDLGNMRAVWAMAQREDTPLALTRSVTVLTRGIMAGLHVNAVAAGRVPGSDVLHTS